MTVSELIEKLKAFDGDLPVWSLGSDSYGQFTHSAWVEVSLDTETFDRVWITGDGP